jgi:tetratricopeptide (TPR) repeat protein
MGQHYLDQKLYSRAEKYFGQGLKIFRNYRCEDDPDIGICLHKLGVIKEALFDDASALDYYLEAIHTFKNINVFVKHVTMASSLHNAALIYMRQRDFHSALDCMTEAFNTKSSAFGSHPRETSESQHFLGIIYLEMKDADSAHFHLTNALNARLECSGVDHLDVARTLFGLGHTHFTRDEFEDAIKCLSEALRISRRRGSSEAESKAELQLGTSYQELGCFEIAIKHLLEALNLMNSSPESSRMDVAQALFRLGICLCETGQLSQSLEKFNECLEMRKVLLGNLHIECANTYESIGIVQQKIECHEEAINSFERALAIKKTSLDKDDEDICVLLHFIGMSLFALEKFEKAVVYFKDSSERKKTHHGRADGEYAMSVIGLASAYAKIGDEYLSVEVRVCRCRVFLIFFTNNLP